MSQLYRLDITNLNNCKAIRDKTHDVLLQNLSNNHVSTTDGLIRFKQYKGRSETMSKLACICSYLKMMMSRYVGGVSGSSLADLSACCQREICMTKRPWLWLLCFVCDWFDMNPCYTLESLHKGTVTLRSEELFLSFNKQSRFGWFGTNERSYDVAVIQYIQEHLKVIITYVICWLLSVYQHIGPRKILLYILLIE